MAIEKTLNTRIQLKYDSYENWSNVDNQFDLKAGEVAIAYLASSQTGANPDNGTHPVMFKVGPGKFNELPWVSALAADVHSWAKRSETEFKTWVKTLVTPSDIDAYTKAEVNSKLTENSTADQKYAKDYADSLAGNYDPAGKAQELIDALDVADTAVTGKYVSAVSETNGKISVTREDLPTYTLASGTANGTVAFNGADVAVTGLGSAAYTNANAYATAAQGALADSAVQTIASGTANGTIKVDGTDVAVTGLGSAAYTEASAYATASQGTKADTAVQKVTVLGKELTDGGSVSVDEAKAALELKSAAYEEASAFDAAGSAAAVLGTAADEATANTVYGAKAAAAKAQSDIDAFFAAAEKGDAALDTLKEIQDFLNSDSGAVSEIIKDVAENKAAIEDIVDGTTTVAKATNADIAAKASGLNESGEAAVKAVKVDNAGHADTADDATKFNGKEASAYLLKTEAPGYDDILTKTAAVAGYQPKGNYATAEQGALADTAVQPATLNNYYTKTEADAEFMNAGEVDAKITALNLDATYEPIGAEKRAKAYADGLAGNYATAAQGAKADTALQEITTTANGGLKVTNKNQIDIDENIVFVLNCGSSTLLVD